MSRTVVLTLTLAVSVGLVACTGAPTAVESLPPETPPVVVQEVISPPSLDAEKVAAENAQIRETGLTPPPPVYRGDCANLLPTADLSELLGVPMTPVPTGQIEGNEASALELHGGIRCFWHSADDERTLYLVALPEKTVNDYAHTDCDLLLDSGAIGCEVEMAGGWIRVSGMLSATGEGVAFLDAHRLALFELFASTISAANLALPPKPAVAAWEFPVDCAAIVGAANLAAVPGLGAQSTGWHSEGSDVYRPQAEVALWDDYGSGECGITGQTVDLYFTAMGGARYNEASIAAAATQAPSVAGIDSMLVTPSDNGRFRVDVFDGPNWLSFEVRYVKNAAPIASALVASLDATAAD